MHLDYILVIGGVSALALAMLALREVALASGLPRGHVDRGPHWFNAVTCLIIAAPVLYGSLLLQEHRSVLERIVPEYPSARYAPEREVLAEGKNWIYVTRDMSEAVVVYYRTYAKEGGYVLTENVGSSTSRLLFTWDHARLFLTIVDEGSTRVLYYSKEGEVSVFTIPAEKK